MAQRRLTATPPQGPPPEMAVKIGHLQQELRCMQETIRARDYEVDTLKAQVATLEEQKMRLAWEVESTKAAAQFFKRNYEEHQPLRVTSASTNRPPEPGLRATKASRSSQDPA